MAGRRHLSVLGMPGRSKADRDAGRGGGVAAEAARRRTSIKALVRGHQSRRRIESGQANSITDLAEQKGVTNAYVCRLLPLTCLAPDIVEAILDGQQPRWLRLARCWGTARWAGMSSGRVGILDRDLAKE
jgi:hypothetical protein